MMNTSRAIRCIAMLSVALAGCRAPETGRASEAVLGASVTQNGITITQSFSSVTYVDTKTSPYPTGFYAAYSVTNASASAVPDVWVTLGSFTGSYLSLSGNDTGVAHLGSLAAGASKSAFFFLGVDCSSFTAGNCNVSAAQGFTVDVYRGPPVDNLLASLTTNDITVKDTIAASANKVTSGGVSTTTPTVGSSFTVTVNGSSGTIGGSNIFALSPQTSSSFPADSFELTGTSITFSNGGSGTYTDMLQIPTSVMAGISSTDYTATYTYRVTGTTSSTTTLQPLAYINSGSQIKHTTVSSLGNIPAIQPAANTLLLTMSSSPSSLGLGGGTVTYTVHATNSGATAASLDELIDALASSPDAETYVNGSSTFAGSAIADPQIQGATLIWSGTFTVPANGSADLTFQTTVPATLGTYTDFFYGLVNASQIDTTADTSDDAEATTSVTVSSKQTTSISISNLPASGTYGGSFTPTYAYVGDGTKSVTSNSTSVCTVTAGVVHYVGVGTCSLTASATAGTNYAATTGSAQTFSVGKATATISIANLPSSGTYGGSFTPTFTYGGDGTPSVSSNSTSVCTVTAGVVHYVGVGTCSLTASATAGTNYAAATGSAQTFSVGQATPTISISNLPSSGSYGGSFTPTFSYGGDGTASVSTNSTSVCTVTSGVVDYVGVGTCSLTASATAGTNYAAATGSAQTFSVGQATTTISIANLPSSGTYGGSFTPTFTYVGDGTASVSSNSTSVCTVTTGVVHYVGVGTCSLTASATAGTNYAAATGSAQTFSVGQSSPAISISNLPDSAAYGGSFTPTFSYSGDGTPSVTSNSTSVCTVTVGVVHFVGIGTCSLTASATAGTSSAAVTGTAQTFSVGKGESTTAVTASPDPSVFGQSKTFTATVSSSGAGTPSGTVTFLDGSTSIGTGTLSGGLATLTTSALAVGSHTITASYGGDASFDGSSGEAPSSLVSQSSTSASLAVSPTSAAVGQSVTLTLTVAVTAPGAGTPTGTVSFYDGTNLIGSATLSGFTASTTATFTSPGSHGLSAVYAGDASFAGSSDEGTAIVTKGSTDTSVSSSPSQSTFAQPVTFTATVAAVAPASGNPGGTVTFVDGSTSLGTVTLVSGSAALTTSSLGAGSHTVEALYNGDASFFSSSATTSQGVDTGATNTTLVSSSTSTTYGDSVTFTATVVGAGNAPTGTVAFSVDGANAGTVPLSGGSASLTTATLGAGARTVTASYGGDSTYSGSEATPITQTIAQRASTTALVSSQNPDTYARSVTFTATVSISAGTLAGSVAFTADGTSLGSATLDGNGTAQIVTSSLAVGDHPIVATYSGSDNILASTAPTLTQTVRPVASTTTLGVDANPASVGQAFTLFATVTPAAGIPVNGTVTFFRDASPLGTVAVIGGAATLVVDGLVAGSYDFTAHYGGTTGLAASDSSAVHEVIDRSSASIGVTASPNPAPRGATVTYTASVQASFAEPAGTIVQFFDGPLVIGEASLDDSGVAVFATTATTPGTHSITAHVEESDTSMAADSFPLTATVLADTTVTTLLASPVPGVFGHDVVFTAALSAGGGTVTFSDGASVIAIIEADEDGVARFVTDALAVGEHHVTASYGGDPDHAASTDEFDLTVLPAASATTLALSSNPARAGDAVTMTATVEAEAIPTGSVLFMDGEEVLATVPLDGVGRAAFTTSALALGGHSLTARYLGDGNYQASVSPAQSETVTAFAVFAALTSTPNPAELGADVTFAFTLSDGTQGPAPTGTVVFRDRGVDVATVPLGGAGSATWVAQGLTAGTHSITATYGGDGAHAGGASASLSQVVNGAPTVVTLVKASSGAAAIGDAVTLAVEVSANSTTNLISAVPTGTVTFRVGTTVIGVAELMDVTKRAAQITTRALPAGSVTVVATYSGDQSYAQATSQIVVDVAKAATTATLAASATTVAHGESITFSAVVRSTVPNIDLSGDVVFRAGETELGRATADASGHASFAAGNLPAGSLSVTASYLGNASAAPSASSPVVITVTGGGTTPATGSSGGTGGGCGCQSAPGSSSWLGGLLLVGLVLVQRVRRRDQQGGP